MSRSPGPLRNATGAQRRLRRAIAEAIEDTDCSLKDTIIVVRRMLHALEARMDSTDPPDAQ